MRILWHSNSSLETQHRIVELLADATDVDLLYFLRPDSGRMPGPHPSANGNRSYTIRIAPFTQLGQPNDAHRYYQWPPNFALRELRPHIIHCAHEQESLMTAELALARWALMPRCRFFIYSWQNILRPRKWPVRLLSRLVLHATDHAFCASTEAADVLHRQGYNRTSTVMPLGGLDVRYYYPKPALELRAQLGWETTDIVVGNIGRLTPEKGLDILMLAIAKAKTQVGPLKLAVVGNGPARSNLEALAWQLGITEHCRFIDAVPPNQVVDYLNLIDIFVLPSRTTSIWKEQFGRVLFEAMGCKTPVIGSSSGAIPEAIGDAGLIFPEEDADKLAQLIGFLANQPNERLALAERGYRRALQKYSNETVVKTILTVWRSFAKRSALA